MNRFKGPIFATVLALIYAPAGFSQVLDSKVDYLGTSRHLAVSGIKVREVNHLLNLAVDVSNSDRDDQQGYYRVIWNDAQGFPAWDPEAWKPILVHGGQIEHLAIVSPTPKATDFKIEFSAERNWAGSQGPR